jgi:hypothetical protein
MDSASEMHESAIPDRLSLDSVVEIWLRDPTTLVGQSGTRGIDPGTDFKLSSQQQGRIDRFVSWSRESDFGSYNVDFTAVVADYKSKCSVEYPTMFQLCSYVLSQVLNSSHRNINYDYEWGLIAECSFLMDENPSEDIKPALEENVVDITWLSASPTTGDEIKSREAADGALSEARSSALAEDKKKGRSGCAKKSPGPGAGDREL